MVFRNSTPWDHTRSTHAIDSTHHRTGMLHWSSAGTSESSPHGHGRLNRDQEGNEAIVNWLQTCRSGKERRAKMVLLLKGSTMSRRKDHARVWRDPVMVKINLKYPWGVTKSIETCIFVLPQSYFFHLDPYPVSWVCCGDPFHPMIQGEVDPHGNTTPKIHRYRMIGEKKRRMFFSKYYYYCYHAVFYGY